MVHPRASSSAPKPWRPESFQALFCTFLLTVSSTARVLTSLTASSATALRSSCRVRQVLQKPGDQQLLPAEGQRDGGHGRRGVGFGFEGSSPKFLAGGRSGDERGGCALARAALEASWRRKNLVGSMPRSKPRSVPELVQGAHASILHRQLVRLWLARPGKPLSSLPCRFLWNLLATAVMDERVSKLHFSHFR